MYHGAQIGLCHCADYCVHGSPFCTACSDHMAGMLLANIKYMADLQMAKNIDNKSELQVWFKLMVVDCTHAKSALMERALSARHALQTWVQEEWHASNQAAIDR